MTPKDVAQLYGVTLPENVEKKTFALAEVRAVEEGPNGSFEVILSAETLDRDGEVVDSKAFDPLPESIPFHAFHDFHDPIGRAVPFYAEDGTLQARGTFASTARAQEIRALVAEGVIGHTSVGFMAAVRKDGEDAPHVVKGELLEGSFVSVPSNREAAVLVAKSYGAASEKRYTNAERLQLMHDLSTEMGASHAPAKMTKMERVQTVHDMSVEMGATCPGKSYRPSTEAPETPGDEPGKSPASDVVSGYARLRAEAALLVYGE